MRAILMFHNCEGQSRKTVSTDHTFWRERRAEGDSNRSPSIYHPNALPLGQTGSLLPVPSLGPLYALTRSFICPHSVVPMPSLSPSKDASSPETLHYRVSGPTRSFQRREFTRDTTLQSLWAHSVLPKTRVHQRHYTIESLGPLGPSKDASSPETLHYRVSGPTRSFQRREFTRDTTL